MIERVRNGRAVGRAHGCVVLLGSGSVGEEGPVVAAAIDPGVEIGVAAILEQGFAPLDANDALGRGSLERAADSIGLSLRGVRVGSRSAFPAGRGPCGPAALCVALVRALASHSGRDLGEQYVFEAALEVGSVLYGRVSTVEAALATWGGMMAFRNAMPVRRVSVTTALPLVVCMPDESAGATPCASSGTEAARRAGGPAGAPHGAMERAAEEGERAVQSGDLERLGWLLTASHRLLQERSLSRADLDAAVEAAHAGGALGARVSPCGGGALVVALADGGREALVSGLRVRGLRADAVEVAASGVVARPTMSLSAISATA